MLLSCVALDPGCYGNAVYGSGSGVAGETEGALGTSFSTPHGSSGVTGVTGSLAESSFWPDDTSSTSESDHTGSTAGTDATTDDGLWGERCPNSQDTLPRKVFVTTDTYQGNLTPSRWLWSEYEIGAERGDHLCQCTAARAKLPGRFIAWLSNDYEGIKSYIKDQNGGNLPPWHFVDTQNVCIATSWDDLLDATLKTPIGRNELGYDLNTASHHAWTGTYYNGNPSASTCDNWADNEFLLGSVGDIQHKDARWSIISCLLQPSCSCAAYNHLYCVQISDDVVPTAELHPSCPLNTGK